MNFLLVLHLELCAVGLFHAHAHAVAIFNAGVELAGGVVRTRLARCRKLGGG